ncbi:uncharacterized protein LOC143182230 [Calliopsis andreniformis]|uniref:uncharacterized protein LOC143182230 n=1 Tax=Calliopsis andreniformis TaxID=337506 RepID=UPI003FCC4B4F
MDRFCLYMPKLSEVATNVWWGPIMAFLMGIIIVLLVLGFSTLVGIGTFDRPFSVIAVILSVSLKTMKLSSLTEKILYLCLVQVATRYMSLLYTELFSETAVGQKELKINEFDDLYPLNVKILMTESMYNFFSNGNESSVPRDLLPKFHVKQGTDKSNINDNNVGYFSMNLLEIYRQDLTERPQKKKTNLCLGNVAIVQMLPIRWWYKDRVNDLFLRTNEYGLRDHENKMNFRWAEDQVMEQQLEEGPSAQRKMVMVLLYGYLFVVAVFVGEVMVKQLQRKKINNKM